MSGYVITADQLVEAAVSLRGVPWRHQGRTRSGVDCIGLVDLACRTAGLNLAEHLGITDVTNYGMMPTGELLARVKQYCTKIETEVHGCLLFFSFPGDTSPRHFAVYNKSNHGTMIHAIANHEKVVEHGYRGHWLKWTDSKWLLPGVKYDSQ